VLTGVFAAHCASRRELSGSDCLEQARAAVRICVANHSFNGQASGNRISGTHNVSWDLFDLTSGASLGRLEISGTLNVNR
jgi:hypothetical protein